MDFVEIETIQGQISVVDESSVKDEGNLHIKEYQVPCS